MLTVRWTTLGPPVSPIVSYVRGVGKVRVTEEDIERYGESMIEEDLELILERIMDDPEARYRIVGPAPKDAWPVEEQEAFEDSRAPAARRPKRADKRSWLDALLGR